VPDYGNINEPRRAGTISQPEQQMHNATAEQIAAAFTEWDRRYREEPERFQSEAEHLLKETPETYGAACAPYFLKILTEIQAK